VAAELERRWELALRAEVEAREAAARFAVEPAELDLDPTLRAQLRDVSRRLPMLWASGRLTAVHKKELLRTLIRRVILDRPRPDTIELKVVWVSGAFSILAVHPRIHRAIDVGDYERMVRRVLVLAAEGYQDPQIARQLAAEGFRSARNLDGVPVRLVATVRRARGQPSLTEQFRHQEKLDGKWTVWGLARTLDVDRDWLYRRINRGTLRSERHAVTGHYLIPDEPDLLDQLRAQLPR
jgi:hypothetical protein